LNGSKSVAGDGVQGVVLSNLVRWRIGLEVDRAIVWSNVE
jgi:hypothetical protein